MLLKTLEQSGFFPAPDPGHVNGVIHRPVSCQGIQGLAQKGLQHLQKSSRQLQL